MVIREYSINNNRPDLVGSGHNIPDDVCTVARIDRDDIIAWTTLDPNYYLTIDGYACCQQFSRFFMPCLWIHLIILSPCLCTKAISFKNAIENTYWILSSSELKVIVMNHDVCIPYCCRTGDTVKSIPLDTITDCGASSPNTVCCSFNCCCDIPTIYVDTASSSFIDLGQDQVIGWESRTNNHEVLGCGLAGYEWFVSEIISRRNALRNHYHEYHGNRNNMMIDRGGDDKNKNNIMPASATTGGSGGSTIIRESFEQRLQKLKDMQNMGMITTEEYEKKRLDIIASI